MWGKQTALTMTLWIGLGAGAAALPAWAQHADPNPNAEIVLEKPTSVREVIARLSRLSTASIMLEIRDDSVLDKTVDPGTYSATSLRDAVISTIDQTRSLAAAEFRDQIAIGKPRGLNDVARALGPEARDRLVEWADLAMLVKSLSPIQKQALGDSGANAAAAPNPSLESQISVLKKLAAASTGTINGKGLADLPPADWRFRLAARLKLYIIDAEGAFHEVSVDRIP